MAFSRFLSAALSTFLAMRCCAAGLVQNGSFELDGNWHTASIHHPDRVSFDGTTASAGQRSLKLDGTGDPIFMLTRQPLSECRPGRRYALRAALRTTGDRGYTYVAIRERRPTGDKTTLNLGRGGARQPGQWQYVQDIFTMSEQATGIDLFLYNIRTQATAWFDDITVTECPEGQAAFALACRRTRVKPVIDGRLTEWRQSDVAEHMLLVGARAVLPVKLPGSTQVGLMYDDAQFYIWGQLGEPAAYERKTTQTGRDSGVYSDDCVELFLAPEPGSPAYVHLCVNASGALYDSWKAPEAAGVGDVTWDSGAEVRAASRPDGWDFEMAIPLERLHTVGIGQDGAFAANVCRNLAAIRLLGSWARLKPGQGFHTPAAFQPMQMVDAADADPERVSPYRLYRGQGYVSNPDFQQLDAQGRPLFWTATERALSHPLVTGYLAAGTRLDLVVLSAATEPFTATLTYRTPDTEQKPLSTTLQSESALAWNGSFTLPQDAAALAALSVECPLGRKPMHVQLAGTGGRRFLARQDKLYAYHVRKNRGVLPAATGAVFPLYRELGLIRGFPSPLMFVNLHTFKEKYYRNDVRLVLDLPLGVEVYSTGLFSRSSVAPEPVNIANSPHGDRYHRVAIPYVYFKDFGFAAFSNPCFMTELEPGEHPPVLYRLVWDKGEQPEETLPVRVYPKPDVLAPKRLVAGVYLHLFDYVDNERKGSILYDRNAPAILEAYRGLGLNALMLANNWSRVGGMDKLPQTVRLVEQMRTAGFEVGLHTSGLMYFSVLAKKEKALAVTLTGETDHAMCPSYRGPAYQALVKTWGDAANYGVYWVDNDFEDWNYRENTICFCERCKGAFKQWLAERRAQLNYVDPATVERAPGDHPDLHNAWWEFKNGLIERWHLDVREALAGNMAAKGIAKPGFPRIGITESQTSWDWKRLTQGAIDYDSPMLYAYLQHCYPEPSVESCGRRTLEYRQRANVDRRRYVVTIAPGDRTGEVVVPDKAMFYQVLEVFGSGAAGFKVWYDTALNGGKYYWLSEAVRMVAPLEDLLLDGTFAVEPCANPNARVHSFTHAEGTVLFVAEYSMNPVTLDVRVNTPRPAQVVDVRTSEVKTLPAGRDEPLKITLDEDRVRLLFVGTPEACRRLSDQAKQR